MILDRVFIFEAEDDFLKERLRKVPLTQLEDRHQEAEFEKTLAKYREENSKYERSLQAYLDDQEIVYFPIDVANDNSPSMQASVSFMCGLLGKPRNYGKYSSF